MTIQRKGRNAFFIYLYMAVIGGILAFLIGYGFHERQTRASAFDRSGVTVTATYTGGRVLRASSRPERLPTFRYFGQVRFLVDDRIITAEAPVSREFHRTVEAGDTIQIRYLSEEPETVQIDQLHETRAFGFVLMIMLSIVGYLGYRLVRKLLSKRGVNKSKAKVVPPKLRQLLTELELEDAHDNTDRTNNLPPDVHQ